jgi:hypothetical protein
MYNTFRIIKKRQIWIRPSRYICMYVCIPPFCKLRYQGKKTLMQCCKNKKYRNFFCLASFNYVTSSAMQSNSAPKPVSPVSPVSQNCNVCKNENWYKPQKS